MGMSGAPADRTRTPILILFFLSGACTLIYEVVWVRMLVLVFGTSVYAVSTVLTAFMAGLALGSILFGRLADRRSDGLKIYAWLELGIGMFAVLFPLLLAGLDDLYTYLFRLMGSSGHAFALVRFVLGFALLLIPTTLMGATLPVLCKVVVRRLGTVGRHVGGLYAVNTFGAVTGAALAAFLLMESFGTRGTIYIAAGCNILIALFAFYLSAGSRERSRSSTAQPVEAVPSVPELPGYTTRLVLVGFGLSGFAALGYEVIWTRLLSVVLRLTTTHSFSTILIAFLFGLAAGGAAGARLVDRWKRPVVIFALLELLLGLFGLGSIFLVGLIPEMERMLSPLPSWWGHLGRLLAISFGVMLPPTFIMGLLFPVVGRICLPRLSIVGKRIGDIYAANTTGAIFGAFAAGFLLIPLFGTQVSIQLLAGVNIALGAVVLALAPAVGARVKMTIALLFAASLLPLVALPSSDHLEEMFRRSQPNSSLLYCDEAVGGTVAVYEFPDGSRVLRVNGAGEVPTNHAAIKTFRLLGNLPMLLHEAPEDVLVIAFGGGITLDAVERHRPRRLDCVEVVPGVLGAADLFAEYNGYLLDRLESGGINFIADDGRNHLLRTDRRYDVIISDSTHPGTADSWVLYTREFYDLCLKRLEKGGLVAQWLPLHGLAAEDYRMILRTFRSVFPHASLWLTTDYTILLGTPDRLAIDLDSLELKLANAAVVEGLAEVDLDDSRSLLAAIALDEEAFARYAGSGAINTDDRPHISFAHGGPPPLAGLIAQLIERADSYVVGADEGRLARLKRRLQARRFSFLGDLALKMGAKEDALLQFRRALSLDPAEPDANRALRRAELSRASP
jgi:spermidine synthase